MESEVELLRAQVDSIKEELKVGCSKCCWILWGSWGSDCFKGLVNVRLVNCKGFMICCPVILFLAPGTKISNETPQNVPVSFNYLHNNNVSKLDLYWILLKLFQQNTTENKESLENELAKVTKDRDLSMKKKDELTGILSQAAQALRTSLMVCCSITVPHTLLLPPTEVFDIFLTTSELASILTGQSNCDNPPPVSNVGKLPLLKFSREWMLNLTIFDWLIEIKASNQNISSVAKVWFIALYNNPLIPHYQHDVLKI